jgi:two-component system, chemotaxis family, chemotaxis protein CheY
MAVDLMMPVLVVDDYNTMIRIIRNLLKQIGFQDIDDAADGTVALGKMREKRYGLVISDWNMEPMTGYELLKEVRLWIPGWRKRRSSWSPPNRRRKTSSRPRKPA